jgi:hypothetical protein
MPSTGQACSGLTGLACDYPNPVPALHMICFCTSASPDASTPNWTCMQLAPCPATQPPYSLANTCTGPAYCGYGSTRCACSASSGSGTWACGLGLMMFPGY